MVRGPHRNQSSLLQLKWAVVLLILSNIALGVFGFWVLRSIDRRYSELIGHSVPLLNNLQTLTAESVEAMRISGPTLLEAPASKREEGIRRGRQVLRTESGFRKQLLREIAVTSAEQQRVEFEQSGEAFTTLSNRVLDLVTVGKLEEAKGFRDAQLRPAFDRYLAGITKAADEVESASLRANDDFSSQTGSMSHIILGVASWPVILIVGLLLFTAAFVLGLMILFRGREANDAS